MITGIGIDIVEINRIQKAIERWGDHFLNHVFTKSEIEYAQKHKFAPQHLAARFAAKEAVVKAIGDNAHIGWKDIEIWKDRNGQPHCTLKNFDQTILISISHTHTYAVANAVITSEAKRPQK